MKMKMKSETEDLEVLVLVLSLSEGARAYWIAMLRRRIWAVTEEVKTKSHD